MNNIVSSLFGAPVRVAELDPRTVSLSQLVSEEAETVRRAVPKRQREFAAGRLLARRLFAGLEIHEFVLRNGGDRAPIWPPGIVGSITHTDRWAAVVVARDTAAAALGCDLELDQSMAPATWRLVFNPRELEAIGQLPASEQGRFATVLFSAKEAAFKAQYPLSKEVPEFQQLEIDCRLESGQFEARFCSTVGPFAAGSTLPGRVRRADGLIATGVTLPSM